MGPGMKNKVSGVVAAFPGKTVKAKNWNEVNRKESDWSGLQAFI